MPGRLVGGYLAWAETVPGSVLIDKQFRGLCTTAWAHSQALLSLPDKTVRSPRKLQGSPTSPRLLLWVECKCQRFLRQARSSGKLSHLSYCCPFYLGFIAWLFCYQLNKVTYSSHHDFLVFAVEEMKGQKIYFFKGEVWGFWGSALIALCRSFLSAKISL